ncbi:hypothetical protein SAMN05216548_12131 [Faunimonas pinastri]|uniref:Glycosyl transferase n=1 Tax=Faunimonas pinastri TaxID=1855383 RepID=A0A1H9PNP2_9HYPH|nr:hypothetical protein [Faunimonas pinastri]SER49429.1 hypothetical protein SAMN05216548_12131 [Faunimonas pinastri]
MKSQSRTACFTICSNNYLPSARVFAASFQQFHPEIDLYLGLADVPAATLDYPPGCTVVPAGELGISDFDAFAFRYDIMELNTAIKPSMFLSLLEGGYDRVLYFDPDIEFFAPLTSVLGALDKGASFVLTPHICSPAESWAPRTDIHIMQTGIFNLGFVACGRQAETETVLRWWARRLRYQCINDQSHGIFVDQKFMDLVPAFTENTCILRDTSCNVAYWNLAQRELREENGDWTVDGHPLTFFHFSGFSPKDMTRISKHTNFREEDVSDAHRHLFQHYADRLTASDFGEQPNLPYGYGRFASGTPIPDAVRRMFRERLPGWSGNPFANLEEYLHLPDPTACHLAGRFMVTNLMRYLYDQRGDLRSRFDLERPEGVEHFVRWYVEHGDEFGLDRQLVEPVAIRAGLYDTRDRINERSAA